MKNYLSGIIILLLIGVFVAYSLLTGDHNPSSQTPTVQAGFTTAPVDSSLIMPKEPDLRYGIVVDDLEVVEGAIKRNQSLSDILSSYNVSYATIDALARNFREVFDVRKIRTNSKYAIICEQDSLKTALHFVYEPNALEYVVFNLKDSLAVYKEMRKVDTVRQAIAGEINYSLYQTMVDAGGSPLLVNELADVFAWQIDFFRIQKGDKFKVLYEELKVGDETVGIGKVVAAYFEHFDNPYYGIFYDQGQGEDYFDEEGNSLRKEFLKAPLNYSRISSRFTYKRFHPVLKVYRPHTGVDYAAPTGTPVHSVGDGIVIKAGYSGGAGHMVKIKHNSVYTTAYLHLSRYAKGIKSGKKVKQGEVIGYVGSTGLSTGPHLDFRFWMNGKPVNPLEVKAPPSEPIKEEHKDAYNAVKKEFISLLDEIEYPANEEDTRQEVIALNEE